MGPSAEEAGAAGVQPSTGTAQAILVWRMQGPQAGKLCAEMTPQASNAVWGERGSKPPGPDQAPHGRGIRKASPE